MDIRSSLPRLASGCARVAAGILKGNHDLEFHWPLLQAAIRDDLAGVAVELAWGSAVQFHEDWWQIQNVYIEHGHRFESMTRVDGEPTVFRGDEVRLPYGSFFNKFVINDLEELDPFSITSSRPAKCS